MKSGKEWQSIQIDEWSEHQSDEPEIRVRGAAR